MICENNRKERDTISAKKLVIRESLGFLLASIHEASKSGFASQVIPAPPSKRPIAPEKTAAIEYPQLSVVQ
jgi:hypothetical protein